MSRPERPRWPCATSRRYRARAWAAILATIPDSSYGQITMESLELDRRRAAGLKGWNRRIVSD